VTPLRYTSRAAAQIDAALSHLAEHSPQGARSVRARLLAILTLLQEHPFAGRPTSHPPVRRIAVTPYPYLLDYRASESEIVILRFRHAARRPLA
jgi:toxin ParE1/3/4